MNRRDLITLLGGAVAGWPLAARGQQPEMPVIGYLSARTPDSDVSLLAAFRQGLGAAGYVENKNVAIQYRFADGQYDRVPELAADLVRRQVAVIVAAGSTQSVVKRATAAIPIVFSIASDPVESGLVASLNRPGGNLTGVTNLNREVGPKLLELLRELVPTATIIGLLINPTTSGAEETLLRELSPAARTLGLQLHVLRASTEREFDAVFVNLAEVRAGALMIGVDPFFTSRSEQLAALTLRHAVPAAYQFREFAAAGGVMSYGGSRTDQYRLVGVYAGRILKGEKPADLPVQQSTKVELIINLKTAKALGLTVPPSLLATADEVIE
jgi:putative tryptophan/tyrosine transport system substrate-binding protein